MAHDGNCRGKNGGECTCFNYKPPIGLRPRRVNDQYRKVEILAAMKRYSMAEMAVPIEWVNELHQLVDI